MIPYHGTPLGGKDCEKPAFLMGRHALVSFAHPRDIEVVAECCQSFVLDNGAFSAWKRGEPITDWKPYYDFCREWFAHPGCDWGIIPDVIDGSEADNDMQIAKWVNWKGWHEHVSRGHLCDQSVPVWHMHESLERLVRLAKAWGRVAMGSSGEFAEVGTDRWTARMHEAWSAITVNGRPMCKVHGLRMMNAAIFHRFPFASVDSTNVAQNSGREAIRHNTSEAIAREIIANRIEPHSSARRCVPRAEQAVVDICGLTPPRPETQEDERRWHGEFLM